MLETKVRLHTFYLFDLAIFRLCIKFSGQDWWIEIATIATVILESTVVAFATTSPPDITLPTK